MLNLGRQIAKVCGRTTRRELLRAGGLAAAGLSLPDLLRLEARGEAETSKKAKSVILLWLWGGPALSARFALNPRPPSATAELSPRSPPAVPGFKSAGPFPGSPPRAANIPIFGPCVTRSTAT